MLDANLATNRVFEHPRGLLDRPRSHLLPLQLHRPLGNSTHKGLDLVSDAVWAKREVRHLAVVRREEPAERPHESRAPPAIVLAVDGALRR